MSLTRQLFRSTLILLAITVVDVTCAADQPLSEKNVANFIELQIEDDAIIARIKKAGVAFAGDEEAIARLKEAGASDAVLAAIRSLADVTKPAAKGAITYDNILNLLEGGLEEDAILKRLEKSPTVFTLSGEQTAELKKAGASDRLLAALAGQRQTEEATGEITDFAIVLDCSGSMTETTKDKQTKMAVAKKVVADLVKRIPNGLRLTFIVYGHDKAQACNAVSVLRQLEVVDASAKTKLTGAIERLQPIGATPIALALRTAGKELAKNNASCGLVLVTDGKESCKGDPAAEAAALARNLKLTFGAHVVGFDIQPNERASLEAIAQAGHGKYFNAETAEELSDSIGQVVKELEKKAKPAEVVVAKRRAVKVVQPEIEDFPALGEIQLVVRGLGSIKVVGKGAYGEEIRVPSATEKYEVRWVAKNGKISPVPILRDHVFSETKLVVLKPEDYLGFVRVKGQGKPKRIIVYRRGLGSLDVVQESTAYGELMVVPAGKWNVRVDENDLEENLEVAPGKIHELM
jgi:Mg-chelatase subunit ChlD